MDDQNQQKWYFKTWSLVASFLCIGPFMLPLVWTHPRLSKKTKVIITVAILVVTYVTYQFTVKSLKTIMSYYQLS
jgi:hypothetical protein